MNGAIRHEPVIISPTYSPDERAKILFSTFQKALGQTENVVGTSECKNADGMPYTEIRTDKGTYLSVDLRDVINTGDDRTKEAQQDPASHQAMSEYLEHAYYGVVTTKLQGQLALNRDGIGVDKNGFPVTFKAHNGYDNQPNTETIVWMQDDLEDSSMHLLIKVEN